VFDCDTFLRVDNSTLSKERFDYARILVATSSFEVLNFSNKILIDGVLVELKIIEEWGFSIGEDVCQLEDDVDVTVSILDNKFDHSVPENREHVEDIINNLADDWVVDDNVTTIRPDHTEYVCLVLVKFLNVDFL